MSPDPQPPPEAYSALARFILRLRKKGVTPEMLAKRAGKTLAHPRRKAG